MNTGTEQYVFVDKGDGYFEPRLVKIGGETDEYYGVESGLDAGERVVTAANFILDSESRLKGIFDQMGNSNKTEATASGDNAATLNIEIVEPKTAKVGSNEIRVAINDASGYPVTDAEVDMKLFMPPMGNMAAMTSRATLKHRGKGEYSATVDFQMAGTWEATITVKRAGNVIGLKKTTIAAH